MTLPASGTITLWQICDEFGLAHTSVWPTAFYGKGGAPGSGTLSFSDFYGRSNVSFDNPPGSYTSETTDASEFIITCSVAAVWTWTRNSTAYNSASPATGGSSTTWDGSCSSSPADPRVLDSTTGPNSVTYTVNASVGGVSYGPWTVNLICDGGTA